MQLVGWIEKIYPPFDLWSGQMDKQKETAIDGWFRCLEKIYAKKPWMAGWIKKQIDGWMAIKITENKYGWLEGYKI